MQSVLKKKKRRKRVRVVDSERGEHGVRMLRLVSHRHLMVPHRRHFSVLALRLFTGECH